MNHKLFRNIVRKQTQFFLREILPRYLERYYFGKGYFFIKNLLTDLDNGKLLEILNTSPPSKHWMIKAKSILKRCPIYVSRDLKEGEKSSVVLGEFTHEEEYISHGDAYYIEKASKKHITIYQGSYEALGINSEDELRNDILETIVHEFVHFFESHFLKSEQELGWREEPVTGLKHVRITFAEARRRDRKAERLRIILWIAAALVTIIAVLIVASGL
jgi:hemerythrin